MASKILLEPRCLRWARERSGLTTAQLAEKLDLDEEKILNWERTGEIALGRAERLAAKTHVPLGALFLSEPQTESLPITDFRTVGGAHVRRPSTELIDTINTIMQRQEWYRDYILSEGGSPNLLVGSLSPSENTERSAQIIREAVRWETQVRAQAVTVDQALAAQISAVEKCGILVMSNSVVGMNNSRKLDVNEFRGFALSDPYAPIIFLNNDDAEAARMFTLAHELVHIFIGESGISNLALTMANRSRVEQFCNRVAAELLVPAAELEDQWRIYEDSSSAIRRLRIHFKVSTLVILRRLSDTHRISDTEFRSLYGAELSRGAGGSGSSASGGPSPYLLLRSRLGKPFSQAVATRTLQGDTTFRDAGAMLNLNSVRTVRRFAQLVVDGAV